jgi:hypothetical protein
MLSVAHLQAVGAVGEVNPLGLRVTIKARD